MSAKHKVSVRALGALVSAYFTSPWIAMLLLGALHDSYAKVPAPGYWVVFFALLLLRGTWQFMIYNPLKEERDTYDWEKKVEYE